MVALKSMAWFASTINELRSVLTTNSDSIPTSVEGSEGGAGGTAESTNRKYAPPAGAIESKSMFRRNSYVSEGFVIGMVKLRRKLPVVLSNNPCERSIGIPSGVIMIIESMVMLSPSTLTLVY